MLNIDVLPLYPKDPIFSLQEDFIADAREDKLNLGLGVYLEENGQPKLLDVVKQAEAKLQEKNMPRGYLPILGDVQFRKNIQKWIQSFVPDQDISDSIVVQTTGCTEALFLSSSLLQALGVKDIHLSDYTWANHHTIFKNMLNVETYPYYDKSTGSLKFDALIDYLNDKKPESILLHACCHNPSGADLSRQEWKIIAQLCQQLQIIPVFDAAYLGFGGSIEEDFNFLSPFIETKQPFFLNIAFSKNLTIYGERLGCMVLFNTEKQHKDKIERAVSKKVRSIHSTPPRHGSDLFNIIYASDELKTLWVSELAQMRERLNLIRKMLLEGFSDLEKISIQDKKGFFLLLPLNEDQVMRLRNEKGIYMPKSGRINISALCPDNVFRFTEALKQVHA